MKIKVFWLVLAAGLSIITGNPAVGLVVGIFIALTIGNSESKFTSVTSKKLLQLSVILLGFGVQFDVIIKVGLKSIWITLIGITFTLILGYLLGKLFKIEKNISTLISCGTAICGGSAIAAVAPAINAKSTEIAVSISIVFLLNAVGLVLFVPLGGLLGLTQEQFGLWAALAIHDTSSVVGAGAAYGAVALGIATTVKLTRAIWIMPLAFIMGKLNKSEGKPKFQWFLLGFLIAGLIRSEFVDYTEYWDVLSNIGKHMMVGTLLLIGAGLTIKDIRVVGIKPLLMAILLWVVVSSVSLILIKYGFWVI